MSKKLYQNDTIFMSIIITNHFTVYAHCDICYIDFLLQMVVCTMLRNIKLVIGTKQMEKDMSGNRSLEFLNG